MIESGFSGTSRRAWLGLIALAAISSATSVRAQGDMLQVPAKSVPVPGTVSPQLAKIIGVPLRNGWDARPQTDTSPEAKDAFGEIALFFDKHLAK